MASKSAARTMHIPLLKRIDVNADVGGIYDTYAVPIDKMIEQLRGLKERGEQDGVTDIKVDIEPTSLQVYGKRPETDKELEKRSIDFSLQQKRQQEQRRAEYERMKQEFEPDGR